MVMHEMEGLFVTSVSYCLLHLLVGPCNCSRRYNSGQASLWIWKPIFQCYKVSDTSVTPCTCVNTFYSTNSYKMFLFCVYIFRFLKNFSQSIFHVVKFRTIMILTKFTEIFPIYSISLTLQACCSCFISVLANHYLFYGMNFFM